MHIYIYVVQISRYMYSFAHTIHVVYIYIYTYVNTYISLETLVLDEDASSFMHFPLSSVSLLTSHARANCNVEIFFSVVLPPDD